MHDCRMLPPRIVYNSRQYLGKDRRHHAAARQRAFSTFIINNPDKHCRRFDRRRAALATCARGLSAASSPHERSDMRESASQIEPRISLCSSGLRSRRPRAQRSMERSEMMRCRPGVVPRSESATIPDQRCTTKSAFTRLTRAMALDRIRQTRGSAPIAVFAAPPPAVTPVVRCHLLAQPRTGAGLSRAADGHSVSVAGRSIRPAIRRTLGEGRRAGAHGRAHGGGRSERARHGDELHSGHGVPLVSASLLLGSEKPTNARGKSCR